MTKVFAKDLQFYITNPPIRALLFGERVTVDDSGVVLRCIIHGGNYYVMDFVMDEGRNKYPRTSKRERLRRFVESIKNKRAHRRLRRGKRIKPGRR